MTCKWGRKKKEHGGFAGGRPLLLLIGGVVFNLVLPEDAHMLSRIAGFFQRHGRLVRRDCAGRASAPQAAG